MEVLSSNEGIVTPLEIVQHIERHRVLRKRSASRPSEPLNLIQTEERLADYLAPHFYVPQQNILNLVRQFLSIDLTRFEIANILLELPKSEAHLMLLIDQCEERYTSEHIEFIRTLLHNEVFIPLEVEREKSMR
ncbi:hypothetical protein RCL1_002081 [Eukaryota sp. TZLM3-RCL]